MGLIDCASGNSIWRGYDYFKENKVSKLTPVGDGIYEAEEEKRQAEIADKLPSLIHKMKKSDIEAALLQVLYDGPEWQYDKFLREYFDIY